jgi:hypothetical protein
MKQNIAHPAAFLDTALTDSIRKRALEAERTGQLHSDQLRIIYEQQWFKMFMPKEFGGSALSFPDILRTEECLSWADGSTAWVVTLCSGAGWFIGFLSAEIAAEIFNNTNVCIAGSGAVTGTATVTDDGFELHGSWKYASGSLHATAFTVNCYIKKGDQQVNNINGTPMVRSFILRKDEVKITPTWNSMGMKATGSHSFEVDHLQVPLNRCFVIQPDHTTLKQSIYQFPFLQLAETTLAVNLSGMATRFMDLCEIIFQEKEKTRSMESQKRKLKAAQLKLNEWRKIFYLKVTISWEVLSSGSPIPDALLKELSGVSHALVLHTRMSVNELYPLCGLEAADTENEINRVWRNFQTAGQHALFA